MHHEKIASTFLKCGEDKKWKDKKSILIIKGKHRRFLKNAGMKKVLSLCDHHFINQFFHDLLYTKVFGCCERREH